MHRYLLTLAHSLNLWFFWILWGGFYLNGDYEGSEVALIMQVVMIVSSLFFFIIRDKFIAQRLFNFKSFPANIGRDKVVLIGCLSGAYVMSLLNIFVIALVWALTGSVDMWVASSAT